MSDYNFIDPIARLVHATFPGYGAMAIEVGPGRYVPSIAHTRCGFVMTYTCGQLKMFYSVMDRESVRANRDPRYVPDTVPVTCVRCLGNADDGKKARRNYKEVLFGTMYGKSDVHLAKYLTMEDREWVRRRSRSVYRRCLRIAQTLYAKALEGTDERTDDVALAGRASLGPPYLQKAGHTVVRHPSFLRHMVRG